jgi:hypothetical protein
MTISDVKMINTMRLDELKQLVEHIRACHNEQEPAIVVLKCIDERIQQLVKGTNDD